MAGLDGVELPDSAPVPKIDIHSTEPSFLAQQANRFANVLLNSSFVALVRTSVLQRQTLAESTPQPASVPEWFVDEWKQKNMGRRFTNQFIRETAIFVGATYLMDAVDSAMAYVRGHQDPWNKVMGGVSAGGFLSLFWYPNNYRARAAITSTGAVVGYLSGVLEREAERVMLEKQRELEKELLHKAPEDLTPQVHRYYLKELMRLKQQQVMAKRMEAASQELQAGSKEIKIREAQEISSIGGGDARGSISASDGGIAQAGFFDQQQQQQEEAAAVVDASGGYYGDAGGSSDGAAGRSAAGDSGLQFYTGAGDGTSQEGSSGGSGGGSGSGRRSDSGSGRGWVGFRWGGGGKGSSGGGDGGSSTSEIGTLVIMEPGDGGQGVGGGQQQR